jgi:hypothetical protein
MSVNGLPVGAGVDEVVVVGALTAALVLLDLDHRWENFGTAGRRGQPSRPPHPPHPHPLPLQPHQCQNLRIFRRAS